MQPKQQSQKKQWTKPTIESVSVEPEEDVLSACQNHSVGAGRTGSSCPLLGCYQ